MPVQQGTNRISRLMDMGFGQARVDGGKAALTNKQFGTVAEQVMRGNGYAFSTTAAGVNMFVFGVNNKPGIWNPPGSGRLFSVIKMVFGRTAVSATPLEASVSYSRLQNVNSRFGTSADMVTATAVAGVNLRSDLGDNSGMLFFPTVLTTTTAPTLWACAGIAQTADDGATTTVGPRTQPTVDQLDGLLCVGPGTLLQVSGSATTGTTYTITIYGLSLPMPLTAN